jgi:large subunit ribosomal protein L18
MKGLDITRWRRRMRVRKRIQGTVKRPRLCVFRSTKHIYAQLIDDERGTTVAAVSTLSPLYLEKTATKGRKDAAKSVGVLIAEMAKAKGVEEVIFDRNQYRYHGRVKAVAEGAREGGLKF